MIIHHGYRDGSGEYFLTVDAGRCDGCGECVKACPKGALEKAAVFVDLEDRDVAGVKDEYRLRLRETCSACARARRPCVEACPPGCLTLVWNENPPLSGRP